MANEVINEIIDVPAVKQQVALTVSSIKEMIELINNFPKINNISQFRDAKYSEIIAETKKLQQQQEQLAASNTKVQAAGQKLNEVAVKAITVLMPQEQAYDKVTKALERQAVAQQKLQQEIAKTEALEAKAEQQKFKLAAAQEKINAANENAKSVPFTTNLDKSGRVIEETGKTSGPVVNQADLEYAAITNAASNGKSTGNRSKEESIDTQELAKAKQALIKAQSELNVELQGYKLQASQANAAAKQEAMDALGMVSAYDRLNAEYKQAQTLAKDLGATYGESDPRAKQAANSANQLAEKLKLIDATVGQFQRNVGNYTGAISILEKALNEVKGKMDSMEASGQRDSEMFMKLQQEANLLYALTNQQAKGFASVTMEIRANERALQTLRAAGLEDTDAFKQLQQEVANAHRELNKFNQTQKLLESNAPTLTAMTIAAKGLAGMYGIGAGTAQLFAGENEHLQKQLNSLVAVMTIIQGLESVNELLIKKNGIAIAIRAAGQKVWNYILTGSTIGIKANTVSTEANTAVLEEENAVLVQTTATMETTTIAEGEMAVGADAVTAATTRTSFAMVALRGAFIASGIGALIILLPTIANAMDVFGNKAKKLQEDLRSNADETNDVLLRQADLLKSRNQDQIKNLESQIAQQPNASPEKQLALQKQLNNEKTRLAKEDMDRLNVSYSGQEALFTKLQKLDREKDILLAAQRKAIADGDTRLVESTKTVLKNREDDYSETKKLYDAGQQALNDYLDGNRKANELDAEQSKFSADEQRKIQLESVNISVDLVKTKNDNILNNEKSTYAERLAALKSNLAAEKTLIEAQKNDVLSNSSSSGADRAIAIKRASAESQKATIAANAAIDKLNEDYAKRSFAANQKNEEGDAQQWADISKKKTEDTRISLQERLDAQTDYETALSKLADQKRLRDLQQDGLTAEEKEAIEEEHQRALNKIQRDGWEERRKIANSDIETQFKRESSKGENSTIYKEIQQYEALRKEFEAGKISAEKYQEQLKKINDNASMATMQTKRRLLTDKKERLIKNGEDTTDVDNQITQNDFDIQKLNNSNTEDEMDKKEKKAERLQGKIFGYTHALTDMTTGLLDAAFDRQMQQLQLIDEQQQKNYDNEKSRIENSTLDAVSKQNRMRMLDKEREIQKDQQEKKERKLAMDKAKFDKDAAIANIILKTAEAIVTDNSNPFTVWKVPIDIALGAAQLAVAAAAPLPHYAKGTKNHPGGLAVVGEEGRELIVTPGRKPIFSPGKATLMDLGKGSQVIPHIETEMMIHRHLSNLASLPIVSNDTRLIENKLDNLTIALKQQTKQLQKAYSEQRNVPIVIKGIPGLSSDYLDRAIYR